MVGKIRLITGGAYMGQLKAESKAQAQYVFVCTRPVLISSRSREVAHVLEWRWRDTELLAVEAAHARRHDHLHLLQHSSLSNSSSFFPSSPLCVWFLFLR
jgi:hypothetical protein